MSAHVPDLAAMHCTTAACRGWQADVLSLHARPPRFMLTREHAGMVLNDTEVFRR